MMRVFSVFAASSLAFGVAHAANVYPGEGRVGACYSEINYPAIMKSVETRELVQAASFRYIDVPAKYKTVYRSVLVSPASTKTETVPAEYKNVLVRVKVSDRQERIERIPATYREVKERVMARAARNVWREGEGPNQRIDANGKIWCLVEEPAVYRTVTRREMVTPASTKRVVTPAKYKTETRRKLVKKASTVTVKIPAVYQTEPVKKMVRKASRRRLETPAKYRTVLKTVVDQPARKNWEEVLCKTNVSRDQMLQVQNRLIENGYSLEASGEFDSATQTAIESYQQKEGLPMGLLTRKTLETMGLEQIL